MPASQSKTVQTRIGIVAPASRLDPALAEKVGALAAERYPGGPVELVFHPQCFLSEGHFAGPDAVRAEAFLEVANDPGFDALWFARGGYGSGRIAEDVLPKLEPAAREKSYLGYSDVGMLLAGLYALDFEKLAHGPMPSDIRREGGVARMANLEKIKEIQEAVDLPVMAKCRIGHFVEAQILQALEVDCLDESEVLSPGQAAELDRVCAAYPHLVDDEFIAARRDDWLR